MIINANPVVLDVVPVKPNQITVWLVQILQLENYLLKAVYVKINITKLELMLYVDNVIINVISVRPIGITVWVALILQEILQLRIASVIMGIIM